MPRGPRLDAPGVLHHVMVRGIERRPLFRDDRDRDDFVDRLAHLAEAGALTIHAWALLPNHVHLLVRTGSRPLARTMRSLLTGYAGAFNRRHLRAGHLFQNRYRSIVVEEEPYSLELVRYLHLNPLRAGTVRDLRALDRYPYTGHAALLGTVARPWQATGEVLSQFAGTTRRARMRYRAFVGEGIPLGRRPELQGGGLIRSLGGWQAVQALRRGREAYTGDERILGSSDFVEAMRQEAERQACREGETRQRRVPLPTLVKRIGETLGVAPEMILGRSRVPAAARARQVLAYVWVERLGRRASELARILGQTRGNISLAAKRGEEAARRLRSLIERWCR
ncbi:MAG: transposase [candidate division NC10 bacterium]|nr:transposase [candidate division NC10 bacterium]